MDRNVRAGPAKPEITDFNVLRESTKSVKIENFRFSGFDPGPGHAPKSLRKTGGFFWLKSLVMEAFYVYLIESQINGQRYIGQTNNLDQRSEQLT